MSISPVPAGDLAELGPVSSKQYLVHIGVLKDEPQFFAMHPEEIKPRTHDEAKDWLAYQGISAAEFCRMHNLPTSLVYEIINGRKRCLRGMSHNIAVLLGMKHGVVTQRAGRGTPGPRASGPVATQVAA